MTRFKCRKTGQILGIVYPSGCGDDSWTIHVPGKFTYTDRMWTREKSEDFLEQWLEQELKRETNR